MKTNQTKKQMINNLLAHCNFNIQSAKEAFERYGRDSQLYTDNCSAALDSVGILYSVGLISSNQRSELCKKIIWRKYDEITPFEVDYSCT